jgi:nucleoid-associated protein YgaU/phage baseplate assembly protein W
MVYTQTALSTATGTSALALSQAVASTFRHAMNALDSYMMSVSASRGYTLINPVLSLPITLSTTDKTFVEARLVSLQSFALGTTAILIQPVPNISAALASGTAAIPYNCLSTFLLTFETTTGVQYTLETPPAGLTASNFAAQAQAAATAWANLYAAANGIASGAALDEISYMAAASQIAATFTSYVTIYVGSTSAQLALLWNSMVACPALSRYSFANSNDPSSAFSQQVAVVRLIATQGLYQFNLLSANLRQIVPANVATYTVRYGDSLMGIAASQLGDYSKWQQIATLNGLLPPYISPTAGTPHVTSPGQQIYMPTNGTPTTAPPAQAPANYELDFLGYDIFYGPLNQDMLPWTGDLNTISGYQNLAFSLGRRLQTSLGELIYHLEFGSRIPPEVGNLMTSETVNHIAAYAISAVMTDPRVQQVVNAKATALTGQTINLVLTALPKGQTSANSIPLGVTFPGTPVS